MHVHIAVAQHAMPLAYIMQQRGEPYLLGSIADTYEYVLEYIVLVILFILLDAAVEREFGQYHPQRAAIIQSL